MFGRNVEADARAHALDQYPREACGLVIGGAYVALANVHPDPRSAFRLPASAPAEYQAVIHSHCAPEHGIEPSAADLRGQVETAVPWGIILTDGESTTSPVWWGDFRLEDPLVGCPFIHGVSDCYSLIERYWWQTHGVRLPVFPRDREWWKAGGNLYLDGFPRAGFREIREIDGAPGDVVLIRIRAAVPNHAAIVLSDGVILHHAEGNLSRHDLLGRWRPYITHWLRRDDCGAR